MTPLSKPFANGTDPEAVREWLTASLARARAQTDALFEILTPAGLMARPIAERHRLIFYLGHLEAFDFNLLCKRLGDRPPHNAHFEDLFAFGIDPIDGQLPHDEPSDWPQVAEILPWRQAMREAVDDFAQRAPFHGWMEQGWAIQLAVEHRLMHAETLCYLLQRLSHQLKVKPTQPQWMPNPIEPQRSQQVVVIAPGPATLGLGHGNGQPKGWDNEYDRHTIHVPRFSIDALPVSNGDWLAFMDARGYKTKSLWSDEDWAWRESSQIIHPAFWRRHGDSWRWIGMFEDFELPLHSPVFVSHAEACAYARWRSAALPSEAMWHRAALGDGTEVQRALSHQAGPEFVGNFGSLRFDPTPSGVFGDQPSPWGVSDLIGNGWEWTRTPFAPFAGFVPLPFYPGYSANFFDGRHFVLKGASARTDVSFLRPSFRNWFQPHYQHVFAKFRLVYDA